MPVYIFRKLTDKYNQILLYMAYEPTCSTAYILLPPYPFLMGLFNSNRHIGHMLPESKNLQLFVPSAASSAISLALKVLWAPVSLDYGLGTLPSMKDCYV